MSDQTDSAFKSATTDTVTADAGIHITAAISRAAIIRDAITMTAITISRVGTSGIGGVIMRGMTIIGGRAGTTAVTTGTAIMVGAIAMGGGNTIGATAMTVAGTIAATATDEEAGRLGRPFTNRAADRR
jgi:hypothetical protein